MAQLKMRIVKLLGLCLLPAMVLSCAAMNGVEPKEFVNSSADVNGGVVHQATVTGMTIPELMLQINALASKRGLVVVKKIDCTDTACKLIYKSSGETKSQQYSSTSTTSGYYPYYDFRSDAYYRFPPTTTTEHTVRTANLTYFSKYFMTMTAHDGVIDVEMIGVPVLNQEMSCPANLLGPYVACTVPVINGEKDIPLSASLKRQWGYDISGTVESDVISGIFTELSMILDAMPAPTPTAPPETENDTESESEADTDSTVTE